MHPRRRTALLGLAAGVLVASVLLADPKVVKTNDGATYRGEVTDRKDNVSVTIRGIETVIPKSEIASIEPINDSEQAFAERLGKLDPKDTPGRIALARQAFDQKRYDLSRDILENALALDPNSRDANDMLELVQSQIRLQRSSSRSVPTTSSATVRPSPSTLTGLDRRVLTIADIEAIRRAELRSTEQGVRIRFVGDVKRRYAESQGIALPDFLSLSPVEQGLAILGSNDASMRQDVHVLSDPAALVEYRRQIQPLVLQNCATIGCHGGSPGGGLVLLNAIDNEAVTYTNFYILQRYTKQVDTPGSGAFNGVASRRLIERGGRGEQSLLACYGLPAGAAELSHPLINGRPIAPIFRNRMDARYSMVVEWMDGMLNSFAPDYGIRFTPPGSNATPSTQPERVNQ